jgi:transcriptional regulator of acetoin/glycerol metabolism
MPLFEKHERAFATGISKLAYCNPFVPERIDYEREALREEFVGADSVWNIRANADGDRQNIGLLQVRSEQLAETIRARLVNHVRPTEAEWELYEDLILYVLYHTCRDDFTELIELVQKQRTAGKIAFYKPFAERCLYFLNVPESRIEPRYHPQHIFACCFQIRRAFQYTFDHLVGASRSAARLRADIWQSIFTRDMPRYLRVLHQSMGDFTTLIVGPSGTGKELVARAIGLSRYIPFDPKSCSFSEDFTESFHPLNVSALSPTLVESELFGHRRGAFTGAIQDRIGWLEVCRPLGTVFLDEVGEIAEAIQVKLLRVLQTRAFQRLGDTQARQFKGKIVAATNRDLTESMHHGKIREDFFYRLCSDLIRTPSLREMLQESIEELRNWVLFICRRITAPLDHLKASGFRAAIAPPEADALADEVVAWIHANLGFEYEWPGNFRELEQCVRNILIRGEYRPASRPRGSDEEFIQAMKRGELTAEELLRRYCSLVHRSCGSYEAAARRLGLDRRTVKAKVTGVE